MVLDDLDPSDLKPEPTSLHVSHFFRQIGLNGETFQYYVSVSFGDIHKSIDCGAVDFDTVKHIQKRGEKSRIQWWKPAEPFKDLDDYDYDRDY